MNRYISHLGFLLMTLSAARAEFPVGQWSNKQEGFKIITLGLRSDGKGYFSPSMAQLTTIVRWHKEGDGVKIKIAAPPENPTATFVPTTDPKIGKLLVPGQEEQDFHLVDEKEPQDLESISLARAKEEAAKRLEGFTTEKTTIPSMDTLLKEVQSFAGITEGMGSRSITSSDWPTSIQLIRTNKRISVQINLEVSQAKDQSPNVTYSYTKDAPTSDLPRTVFVDSDQRERLKKWAESEGLNHEFAFYQAKGPWGLERHFAFFSAYVDADPSKVASIVQHLAAIVFNQSDGPFIVTEAKRK